MAMIRAHAAARGKVPLRLIYSVRTPADVIYAAELSERSVASALEVTYLYTRAAPGGRANRTHQRGCRRHVSLAP
jgi:ferredoxin-NADP reductase